jgi:hypothetical protein
MTPSTTNDRALPPSRLPSAIPDGLLAELMALDDACGSSATQYDRVITLITASIDRGANSGPQIVEAITQAGFTKRYVGLQLSKGLGPDPARHWWTKDADGRYELLA